MRGIFFRRGWQAWRAQEFNSAGSSLGTRALPQSKFTSHRRWSFYQLYQDTVDIQLHYYVPFINSNNFIKYNLPVE